MTANNAPRSPVATGPAHSQSSDASVDLPETSQESAAEIARRVATELHQLSKVTARIECAVSGLILNSPGGASGLHHDLQSLDSLGQMLDALAQFLNDMAAQIPPGWQFDPTKAASSIKLKDLAQRLANQKQTSQSQNNDECELF